MNERVSGAARPSLLKRPREPGFVTALRFGRNPLDKPRDYFTELGDTFTTRVFGERVIMTRDPAWIHEVLVRKAASFHKDKTTRQLSKFLGEGLLTTDGETWRTSRRTLQPHFLPREIDGAFEVFTEEARR